MVEEQRKYSVTFFIPTLGGGGAERVVVNLVNGLSKSGEEVNLLLFEKRGVYFDEIRPQINIHALSGASKPRRLLSLFSYFAYLRAHRPDAVVVSGHSAFLVAWIGRLVIRHRLIVIVHNTVSREPGLSRFIARWLYRFANKVVAVSKGVARDIQSYAKVAQSKLVTIYNPIDTELIKLKAQSRPEHRWFADDSLHIVVAVGALTAQKNYPFLLKTIAEIKRKKNSIRLIILGEGPLLAELEKQVASLGLSQEVDMPGFDPNPFGYMAYAERFVLTSNFEGFGMVLVEALASGARVVATDCPSGPSEILEMGRWGKLVPLGDVEALAEALMAERSQFPSVAQAKDRARSFDVDVAVKKYCEVIHG